MEEDKRPQIILIIDHGSAGASNGGAGGAGGNASAGAGNPSGGTGGLLVIYAKNFKNNVNILSNGSQSGGGAVRGGASGGGSINIFYLENYENNGTINADGPASSNGGTGGKGTVTAGKISNGTFIQDT